MAIVGATWDAFGIHVGAIWLDSNKPDDIRTFLLFSEQGRLRIWHLWHR